MKYGCIIEDNNDQFLNLTFFGNDQLPERWLSGEKNKLIHYGNHVIDGWVKLDRDGIAPLASGDSGRREGQYDSEGNEIFDNYYNEKFAPMTVDDFLARAESLADSAVTAEVSNIDDALSNFKTNIIGYYGTAKTNTENSTIPFCKMKPCMDVIPEKNSNRGEYFRLNGRYFEYVVFVRNSGVSDAEPLIISYMLCSTIHAVDHIHEFSRPLNLNDNNPNVIFYRCFYKEYNRDTGVVEEKYRDFKGRSSLNDASKFFSNDYVGGMIRFKWGRADLKNKNYNRSKDIKQPLNNEYNPEYIKSKLIGVDNADTIIEKVGVDSIADIVSDRELFKAFYNTAIACNNEDPDTAADIMLMFCSDRNIPTNSMTTSDALNALNDIDDKVA